MSIRNTIIAMAVLSAVCAEVGDLAQAEEPVPNLLSPPLSAPTATAAPQGDVPALPTTCDEPSAPEPPAEETAAPPGEAPALPELPSIPELQKKVPEFIDLLHGELSRELMATAARLDSFFGDERAVVEENRSYLRVRYDVFTEERSDPLIRPAADLRLVLPQLEKKTHLVFSMEPTTTPAGARTPVTTPGEEIATTTGKGVAAAEERNLTTALLYLLRSVPRESIIIRTGVQLSKGQPVLFGSPRYRTLVPLASWDLRFTQEALYRTDTGWQTDTRFDFERNIPPDLFFRTSIDGVWLASTKGYFYSLSFSLRQAFGLTHALDYEWINVYQTRPVHELVEMAFRIRYRHSFLREWLFFELAPQVRSPRERGFDAVPGILFRLEMYFGRQAS